MFALYGLIVYYMCMKPEDYIKQKPIECSTIYIDMDSFFASVEQYYQPKLRGKPVAVATGTTLGASIIAASYQAKQRGIHTGIKVADAMLVCPDIHIVYDSPNSYRAVHTQIMNILHGSICNVGVKGIDEAYLKVPSYARDKSSVLALIKAINSDIYKLYNEHICCSIGVASNIWLAKMAASSQKPKGLVWVNQNDIPQFYNGLRLQQLTGIGRRMAKQFQMRGVYTPNQIYSSSWQFLTDYFGVNGQKWYLRMRGIEVDIGEIRTQKSLGHQVTTSSFVPITKKEITTIVLKVIEVLGKRLRKKQLKAQGLSLSLYYSDKTYRSFTLEKMKTFDANSQIMIYTKMLLKKLRFSKQVKKISLTLLNLTDINQLELAFVPDRHKDSNLSLASDKAENRYNYHVISSGNAFFDKSFSLNKIGFAGDLIRATSEKLQ